MNELETKIEQAQKILNSLQEEQRAQIADSWMVCTAKLKDDKMCRSAWRVREIDLLRHRFWVAGAAYEDGYWRDGQLFWKCGSCGSINKENRERASFAPEYFLDCFRSFVNQDLP